MQSATPSGRIKHEREESNPVEQFWRLPAHPGAHSYQGCLKGVEPLPPGSQPGMQKPLHNRHQAKCGIRMAECGIGDRSLRIPQSALRICSGSTRIRTWNTSLEPRHDCPFHHRAVDIQWTSRGVEPRSPGCKPGVFPLDELPEASAEFGLRSAECQTVRALRNPQSEIRTPQSNDPGWN